MPKPNRLGDGIVRRWGLCGGTLGHEGRAFMNGISALTKEARESSLSLTAKRLPFWKQILTRQQTCQHLDLGFLGLQNYKK